ncbi:MAG: hypothetical protein HRU20_08740 [Pseudomonadales bacterium]|nr:hypothetical protein [Pseudomonadales bacterium]
MNINNLPYKETWIPVCHQSEFLDNDTVQDLMGGKVEIRNKPEGYEVTFTFQGEEQQLPYKIINEFMAVWIGDSAPWDLKEYDMGNIEPCAHDTNEIPVSIIALTSDAVDFGHFESIHKLYDIDHKSEYRGHESFLDMDSSNADFSDRPILARLINLTQGRIDAGFRTKTTSWAQGPFIANNDLKPFGLNFSILNLYMIIPRDKNRMELQNVYYFTPLSIKLVKDKYLENANKQIKSDMLEGYRESLESDFPYWVMKDANKEKLLDDPDFNEYFQWISQFVSADVIDLKASA